MKYDYSNLPLEYPNIFNRISHGLKEDYIDPIGRRWAVKAYLAGKTGEAIYVWHRHKFLGRAYCTVRTGKEKENDNS